MKRFAIILTIVAATAMIFSACGKYEEGPALSLLTKSARITGTWTMTEMTSNDVVQDMQGVVIKTILEKDGTGTMTYSVSGFSFSSDLEWKFDDTKENLMSRVKETGATEFGEWSSSEIIKLTNSECWLRAVNTVNSVTVTTISKMTKD